MSRKKRFVQGIYKPKHSNKYIGNGNPIFRSSWEKKFFEFCDNTETIICWASEPIPIPYYCPIDNKKHKYFVDFYVEILEGTIKKKYLIEIKPYKQTIPPKESKRKKKQTLLYEQLTWVKNQYKWEAAKKFAASNGMEFKIITEKELNINKNL